MVVMVAVIEVEDYNWQASFVPINFVFDKAENVSLDNQEWLIGLMEQYNLSDEL